MLDPVTLDQLRTLVAVVEEGSFSAAARKLRRVQSAVSASMANLESQLGVPLWDRSTKIPTLTDGGRAVLAHARRVVGEMDALRAFTSGLTGGVEAKVSLCVDALFPVPALVEACAEFARTFPAVDLRVDTETMSAVSERVLEGGATLGVVSPLGVRPGLERRALAASIRMVPVASATHPLAAVGGRVPTPRFAEHVQIVLSERHAEGVPDQAVLSPRTWRVADLPTKHAMIRHGLGWGNLPEHLVGDDLARRRLVRLRPEAWADDEHTLHFHAVRRPDQTSGPAHRWLIEALERRCGGPPTRGAKGRRAG
jgi:DNA-binding transcriptional LysR family regulator